MGFFSNKSNNSNQLTETKKEMEETKARFFSFIEKLEQKVEEFSASSLPELVEMNQTDTDEYKRSYQRMKAAVIGQLDNMQQKALEVKNEKIKNFELANDSHELNDLYYDSRNECYERYNKLEELIDQSKEQINDTYSENYETKYQSILDEFEATKNNFHCSQCSSPIEITKIFFTITYITCPSCQTKNTFEPSTQAKQLEHIGRSLAEQRTKHLLKEFEAMPEKAHELYLQIHDLELDLMNEKNKTVIEKTKNKIKELEQEKQFLEEQQPIKYQHYLRAMFDEWNKINPALTEEHERFYNRLLTDYNNN